jgi:hypothetical protein
MSTCIFESGKDIYDYMASAFFVYFERFFARICFGEVKYFLK